MDFIPQAGIANRPLGYAQITNLTAAVGLPAIPEGTVTVVVMASINAVRFRDDGVNPTAAIGFPIVAGMYYEFMLTNYTNLKFIETGMLTVLDILYYGR